jgi:uncharacterized protein (DUF2164 family)
MAEIKFSKEEKQVIIPQIQLYFREELRQEIGSFDAEFLLDFFAEEIGPFFYNRALYEAVNHLNANIEQITDGLYQLEKTTPFIRD